jgi:SMODS and SLOG-associating 2TM effector domain 1/SMODS and SLOG-associating 2TM effector domain 3
MENPSERSVSGLSGAWTAYRMWAATARHHRNAIDFWNRGGLWLAIAGATLAALGQQLVPMAAVGGIEGFAFRAPGVLGAAVIALATYFSSQAVSGSRDRAWIRCRAAAESIRSAIYLYRASVPPFDTAARAAELSARVEKALEDLSDIEPRPPDAGEPAPALDALTVDRYIGERVSEQIGWYRGRAADYQKRADRCRRFTLVLGAVSVLLGLASAAAGVSAWLGVIATATASITAHVKNQRYQTLIGVYLATATRLELLKDQWADSGKTDADKPDRDAFIQRCEETMALENSAWLAQWKDQGPSQTAPVSPPDAPAGADRRIAPDQVLRLGPNS